MGAAIIGGLLAKGSTSRQNIVVSEPWDVNRKKIEETLGVRTSTSNIEAGRDTDVLVLAVKPQVAKGVCQELAAAWGESKRKQLPLVVSIVGGITLDTLTQWFTVSDGRASKVVRVMPNTPALLGEGASASFAGPGVSEEEKKLVTTLLQSFSKVAEWVEKEELINVVTGLSGMIWLSSHLFSIRICRASNTYESVQDPDQLTSSSSLSTWFRVLLPWDCRESRPSDWLRKPVSVLAGCSLRHPSPLRNCVSTSLVPTERLKLR